MKYNGSRVLVIYDICNYAVVFGRKKNMQFELLVSHLNLLSFPNLSDCILRFFLFLHINDTYHISITHINDTYCIDSTQQYRPLFCMVRGHESEQCVEN